jgi:hypothetical protein
MLSKCANPACNAVFRYLHEGKVFRLERRHDDDPEVHCRDFEYFWLCSSCASSLTVVFEQDTIQVRPSHVPLSQSSRQLILIRTKRIA